MSPPISDDARSNSDSTPDELLPDPVCVGVLAQLGPLMKTDDELMALEPPRVDPMAVFLIQPGGAWHKHKWPRRKARPMVGRYE